MRDKELVVLGIWLMWFLFSLGSTVAVVWIVVHFVRKYW